MLHGFYSLVDLGIQETWRALPSCGRMRGERFKTFASKDHSIGVLPFKTASLVFPHAEGGPCDMCLWSCVCGRKKVAGGQKGAIFTTGAILLFRRLFFPLFLAIGENDTSCHPIWIIIFNQNKHSKLTNHASKIFWLVRELKKAFTKYRQNFL